jgi:Right handed beta helix region
MRPGACYLVNEGIRLKDRQGLTVSGGEYKTAALPQDQGARNRGHAVFWLVGGSHVTFESMQLLGANHGGYHQRLALEAGVRSDGVDGLAVSNTTISGVYGDGIELNVLRGAQDDSRKIIRPSENVTVTHVTIGDAGRAGISVPGASNVSISDVNLSHIGINDFDVEADQGNEGAKNVTIDGCTANGAGGAFFAGGGAGYGLFTSDVNVENCTMSKMQGGFAIYVDTVRKSLSPKGPINFANDHLICSRSSDIACVSVTGGNVAISESSLTVPPLPPGDGSGRIYTARHHSTIVFNDVTAKGYGRVGKADNTSTVSVIGGTWERAK